MRLLRSVLSILEMTFSKRLAVLSVLSLLAACQSSDVRPKASAVTESGFAIRDLPDPATWNYQRIANYFGASGRKGYVHYYDHSISSRLSAKCGAVMQYSGPKGSYARKIAFYERLKTDTPRRAKCWSDTAPTLYERRIQEIIYLKKLAADFFEIPPPTGQKPVPAYAREMWDKHSFDKELASLERDIRAFGDVNRQIDGQIRQQKQWRRADRKSWERAITTGLNNFSKSNVLAQPPPGSGMVQPIASSFPNASPELRIALDNLDRTMMGEEAYARVLGQRAAAAAAQSAYASSGSSGSAGSITLTRVCYSGENPDGSCVTKDQLAAQARERENAEAAQMATERARTAQKAREMAAAAQSAYDDRMEKYAKSCGYNSWPEMQQKAATYCK